MVRCGNSAYIAMFALWPIVRGVGREGSDEGGQRCLTVWLRVSSAKGRIRGLTMS